MKHHTVLDIIEEIAANPSILEKTRLLKEQDGNGLFRTVCQLAYEPSLSYYISRPAVFGTGEVGSRVPYDLEAGLHDILEFTKGDIRGGAQREQLTRILHLLAPADAEVICRVLDRDLRFGAGTTLINKTWPGLISTFDFLLADTDTSHIDYPAISQVKEDGMRCKLHIAPDIGRVTAISRQGKPIEIFDFFDEEALKLVLDQAADLDGELICFDGDSRMPRKVSNGILNKAIKGTISREEAATIRFVVWDIDDPTGDHEYLQRFMALERQIAEQLPSRIMLIESKIVNDRDEATAHFKEIRKRGLEGTIVKNLKGKWVPKRSKDLCKFKAEIVGTFEVTGFEKGTGKNKDRVGALFIQSADSLVKSKVGIFKDFDESIRDEWMLNIPKFVDVLYNERITDKSRKDGTESLFLPRVVAVRLDKGAADTRADLIALENAILEG